MRPQLTQSQFILLVEDNQDDYEATCRAFGKANLRNPIVWCKSGRDALDCLKQQGAYRDASNGSRAGLVLLDLNMPGMDGFEVLTNLRSDRQSAEMPGKSM